MFTAVLIDFGFRKIWTHLYLKYKYGRNQKKHIKILILVIFDQVLWMNVLSTFKIFLYFSIFYTIKKKSTSCRITRKNPSIWKMFCCGNQFLLLIGKLSDSVKSVMLEFTKSHSRWQHRRLPSSALPSNTLNARLRLEQFLLKKTQKWAAGLLHSWQLRGTRGKG